MGEVGLWRRYRGVMVALISYGRERRGGVLDRRDGERRGKEEVSFVISDLSVELSWWL